jgi:hypothetical protein
MSGSEAGRAEKDQVTLAPRRSAEPTALLHWFRRLCIRWEIRDDIHQAFVTLGCAVICWRWLKTSL